MMTPSAMVLINCIDIYPAVGSQDAVYGYAPSYAQTPSQKGIACSVQYTGVQEVVTELDRITQVDTYTIIFGINPGVKPRDKIVWTEGGITRTLVVQGNPPSEAGRGGPWTIRCIEKI